MPNARACGPLPSWSSARWSRCATSSGTAWGSSLRQMSAAEIVLLAHGSPDPRHSAGVEALAARVREHAPGRPVHTAYLDHQPPGPLEVAAALAGPAVLVPVLVMPA